MIIDRFRHWKPAPGSTWQVRPTARTQERVRTAPAAGGASFLQGDHLRAFAAAREQGRQHRAYTGTIATVPHPLDRAALGRATTRLLAVHENLRAWFDLDGPEPVCHLAPADGLELEIVPDPVPEGPWPEALHAHMERTFDQRCRPDRWAPFVLGVVERADSFSLWWGCDHAFTDGASQLMVLDDLADLYRDEAGLPVDPAGLVDVTPAGSYRAYVEQERELATDGAAGSQVDRWCQVVADHDGRLPRSPIDLGLAPGETAPAVPTQLPLVDGENLRELERRARAAGSSVQAAVYAALAVASCELTGASDFYGVTVLSTRDAGTARTFGWLCNFAPVVFAVDLHAPADRLLAGAAAALADARAVSAVPVHAALGAMIARGITTPERLGSPQMVSYLDIRRFPAAGREPYESAVHFTGEGRTANSSVWVQREDERLYLVMQHPDDAEVAARCREFVAGVSRVLEQLAAGCVHVEAGLAPAHV